jgi:hypothetical protein
LKLSSKKNKIKIKFRRLPSLQSSVAPPAVAATTITTRHRCIVRCSLPLLRAPTQLRRSVATTPAVASQGRELKQRRKDAS